jgi:hypothetical protein
MQTLLLDPDTWDLTVDGHGNIAVADPALSLAQDAAAAIRLFRGELWYDIGPGVPYWEAILGKWPPVELMKAKFNEAALSVLPEGFTAECFITSIVDRRVAGQVQIKDSGGTIVSAAAF